MTKLVSSFEYYDWQTDTYKTVIRSVERQNEPAPAPRGSNNTQTTGSARLIGPAIGKAHKAMLNKQKRPDFPGE